MRCADCKWCRVPKPADKELANAIVRKLAISEPAPVLYEIALRLDRYECRRYPRFTETREDYWCGEFHDRNH